jgi:hypothetical protein
MKDGGWLLILLVHPVHYFLGPYNFGHFFEIALGNGTELQVNFI